MSRFLVKPWDEDDNTWCIIDDENSEDGCLILPNGKTCASKPTCKKWAKYYELHIDEVRMF